MSKIFHSGDYKVARQLRYPPLADLADALYHNANGNPALLTAYLAKIAAVKKACPKPTQPDTSQLNLNLTVTK